MSSPDHTTDRSVHPPTGAGAERARLADVPDDGLVQRALGGDELAFETIMRRHNQRLFRIARGVLADDSEAEDAVQETYIRAFTQLARYAPSGKFGAWLARIALNEALMRKRKRNPNLTSLDDIGEPAGGPTPESAIVADVALERMAAAEARQLLEHAIDALPESFRMVVILRMVEQMTIRETAACLELNAATVKTRLHRGIGLLHKALERRLKGEQLNVFEFDGERCDRIVAAALVRLMTAGAITKGPAA